jgi:hypothetical protein
MEKVIGDRTHAIMDVTLPLPSGFTKFGAGHEAMTSKVGCGPPGILINSTKKIDRKCSQPLDLKMEHRIYVQSSSIFQLLNLFVLGKVSV